MAAAVPIAIIGLGCRFPQAPDPAAFWRLLERGMDAVGTVPPDRWDCDELYDPQAGRPGKINTRFGAFLDDVRGFDAAFFGISPREAVEMDPQQRLLLEIAWETLESAGMSADRLAGSATGVFIGIGANDYSHLKLQRAGHRATINAYTGTGQAHSVAANRLSYTLDLRGPSMAIDTACSSSLIAINLACRSLAAGESELAIAGGVNLIITPDVSIAFSHAHMLAPDGRCKSFDAAADGYVRGEGCGLLLLKRLDAALRDGDPIAAVIAGTSINQDGRSNGLTAPSGLAQLEAVRGALADAGIEPRRISYVEAHGTGTPLGDPIEVRALATALGGGRPADAPALMGSVKTNIGHLECASGVAGVIKVVLALLHERIPRSLHFRELNPLIELGDTLQIAAESVAWPRAAEPRYAGVSSYGFGGANAHLILREAPPAARFPRAERDWHLVTFSAKSERALLDLVNRAASELAADARPAIEDIAFTACAGRTHFSHRFAIPVRNRDELRDELEAIADGRMSARVHTRRRTDFGRPRIGMLFSGQGAQYTGMAQNLRATSAVFRAEFERCAAIFDPLLDAPLADLIDGLGDPGAIHRTANTQPALFAIEYALAKTWIAWGITPHALLGHSVGEYAAAAIAGMMTLESAAGLIAARARHMQALAEPGAMAALLAPEANVAERIRPYADRLSIAAVNGRSSTIISGAREAVERVVADAERDGIITRGLQVSHAFHSPLVEPMLDAFEREAAAIAYAPPNLPVISNLTGRPHAGAPNAAYWRRHARETVDFAGGVGALAAAGCDIFLEVGPDSTLCGMTKDVPGTAEIALVPSLRRGRDEWRTLCDAAGMLYVRNAPVDWRAFYRDEQRHIVTWPTYPFQREPYWLPGVAVEALAPPIGSDTGHPLLGRRIAAAQPLFSVDLSLGSHPYLADHALDGQAIFPASGFVELALAAALQLPGGEAYDVVDVALRSPLLIEEQATTLQTQLHPDAVGGFELTFHSRRGEAAWTAHGGAILRRRAGGANGAAGSVGGTAGLADDRVAIEQIAAGELYDGFTATGLRYGPAFRGVSAIERHADQADGRVEAPAGIAATLGSYRLHPALLDACFQVAAATVSDRRAAYIPTSIERIRVGGALPARVLVAVRRRDGAEPATLIVDVRISTEDGRELVAITGLRAARQGRAEPAATALAPAPVYAVEWEPLTLRPVDEMPPGRWLVSVGGPRGEALARALGALGASVTRGNPSATTPVAELSAYDALLFATPLDGTETDDLSRLLAQTRAAALAAKPPRIVLCTAGAQALHRGESATPAAAALWGFGATVALEHPELRFTCVDASERAGTGEAASLARTVIGARDENRIALRDAGLYAARLAVWAEPQRDGSIGLRVPSGPFRLRSTRPGLLDALAAVPAERVRPGAGEVVIEVGAAGLNFRDVMKALGVYPSSRGADEWLGDECAGVVVAIGDGVAGVRVGERVMALAPAAFGRFARTRAELVAPIPPHVDDLHAAAIPVAYCTAWYALAHVARTRPGERVLIHAAAGGVGFAAVAVAQALGAEVFATAGSDEKRDFVRGLGVEHVFDSRSLDFVEEIRAATGGVGVDVALNSLAGEAIPATLSIMAPFGRFIEIGKTDIYSNSRLPMQPFARNVSFSAVDMDALLFERPALGRELFAAVSARIADRRLPLPPVTSFALSDAPAAFRHMAQARQIGKIVLTLPPGAERPGTYVVTGGLGGLGPAIAEWLHRRGAATIVLAGRNAPDEATGAAIERCRAAGAAIVCERVDVTSEASVAALMARVRAAYPPLRGVVHAAGLLDDGLLLHQTDERFGRVLRPKIDGAEHLDRLTAGDELDHFLLFSSAAHVLGSPGQSNYAAANAALAALAHRRRGLGRPALAVNWGPWAGPGMASRGAVRALAGPVAALDTDAAFAALDRLIDAHAVEATVIDIDWSRWRAASSATAGAPLVRALLPAAAAAPPGATAARPTRATVLDLPADQRMGWLERHIAGAVAFVMDSASGQDLPVHASIRDLGVDSLMGLELQLRFEEELGVTIPRVMLMQAPSIHDLASAALTLLEDGGARTEPVPAVVRVPAGPVASVARAAEHETRIRLLCFSHAGTSKEAFRGLGQRLGSAATVVPIDYPGRIGQRDRLPATSMDELIAAIMPEVQASAGEPFALFGHSLGALVAFEVARRLEAAGRIARVLFVSGSRAPFRQLVNTRIAHLDDGAFTEQIRSYNGTPSALLEDREYMRVVVPVMKADFTIAESYGVGEGVRISSPVVAFGGDADPFVGPDDIAKWSRVTNGTFASSIFRGDHFFLVSALPELSAAIVTHLNAFTSS